MIVAAMLANLDASSASSRTNARVAEFQTNGRYRRRFPAARDPARGLRRRELDQSCTELRRDRPRPTTAAASGFRRQHRARPIWGANDSNPFSGTCIPAANYARGDILGAAPRRPRRHSDRGRCFPRTGSISAPSTCRGSVFVGPTRPRRSADAGRPTICSKPTSTTSAPGPIRRPRTRRSRRCTG